MHENDVLKPRPLEKGSVIGIFTPSWPGNVLLREKYLHGIDELKKSGYHVCEGSLTASLTSEGYRLASAKERADEFMELVRNPDVDGLMATIGGWNSASLIPFLNFEEIRAARKILCGYSDITALHMAILKYSKLSTLYGPTVIPTFGEYPHAFEYSVRAFNEVVRKKSLEKLTLQPPEMWSDEFIDAGVPGWKGRTRTFTKNAGWKVVYSGAALMKKTIIANVETLLSLAGTDVFPDVTDKILVLEETEGSLSKFERNFTHLQRIGVFDKIAALVLSKPGVTYAETSPLTKEDLFSEVVGFKGYPVVFEFDCGHTFPMLTLPQHAICSVYTTKNNVVFSLNEATVTDKLDFSKIVH